MMPGNSWHWLQSNLPKNPKLNWLKIHSFLFVFLANIFSGFVTQQCSEVPFSVHFRLDSMKAFCIPHISGHNWKCQMRFSIPMLSDYDEANNHLYDRVEMFEWMIWGHNVCFGSACILSVRGNLWVEELGLCLLSGYWLKRIKNNYFCRYVKYCNNISSKLLIPLVLTIIFYL